MSAQGPCINLLEHINSSVNPMDCVTVFPSLTHQAKRKSFSSSWKMHIKQHQNYMKKNYIKKREINSSSLEFVQTNTQIHTHTNRQS